MVGDRYHWVAQYTDGTSLPQIDSKGNKNAYQDIDRNRLSAFELWEGPTRILFIRFRKGQKLIWRRRVETSPGGITEVCHIIGKQEIINGKNYQGIFGIFESDGRVEVAGRFEEHHPWFYPIKIHDHEGEEWIG